MKRSRIFLGLTTVCLAIAGAVLAKVTHFGSRTGYYYTVVNNDKCMPVFVPCGPTGSYTCSYPILYNGQWFIRTVYTSATCINKLFYTPE